MLDDSTALEVPLGLNYLKSQIPNLRRRLPKFEIWNLTSEIFYRRLIG